MPVKIHKLFNFQYDKTDEAKQAGVLCEFLEEYLPKEAKGNIYVLPNMTCPRAKNKDLDLVVWFDTEDLIIEVISGVRVDPFPTKRKVNIVDALIIFEIKSHNTYHSIKIQNQQLELSYPDGAHNATSQSNGQKQALINFLKEKTGISPFVVNLIWLYNAGGINHYDAHTVENILWGNPNLKKLFEVICRNNLPIKNEKNEIIYRSSFSDDIRNKITDYFKLLAKNTAIGIGRISRKKITELISKDIADIERNYFNDIGNKITIINGNPGTGKTVHLIYLANNLYKKRGLKCLILTFNKALQQDIKRLIYYSGLSDANSINILTWDSFTYKCLSEYEQPKEFSFDEWTEKLNELVEMSNNSRNEFKTAQDYDCVLIDEGQDWSEIKKNIIFKLFGYQYTIVSIGKNQLVQSENELNWKDKIGRDFRQEYYLEVSHRNKTNIVDFLLKIGKSSGFKDWEFVKNENLIGGQVIITNDYNYTLHLELVKDLQENENSFYDMMLLGGTNAQLENIESLMNNFGFKGFVANKEENRNQMFPLDQFRIMSYQACRGLEAWTLVCFEWDIFLEDTLNILNSTDIKSLVKSLTFIVMTRAIDTLVITLKNKNSETSKQIINVANALGEIRLIKLT